MATPESTFTVGDYVVLDHPDISATYRQTVFAVAKVNKVNLHLTPVGGGKRASAPMHTARHATLDERTAADTAAKAAPAPLYLGSVVTARGKNGHYVVVGLPSGRSDRYRVAQLGGTENNAYLSAPRSVLDLVERNTIRIA